MKEGPGLDFVKMHGLGNDFIIINGEGRCLNWFNFSKLAAALCDRHLGIGADGLIIALPSERADIQMRIINSDGSEPAMCGNAIRCFAKYLFEHGLIKAKRFTVETQAGLVIPELMIHNDQVTRIKVNMGKPRLLRREIPMSGPENDLVIAESLKLGTKSYLITSLLMNVPHTVIFTNDLNTVSIKALGPAVEKHPIFPQGTNVNLVQVLSPEQIKIQTWERGAGHTLACGTGCSAAVVAGVLNAKTRRNVLVQTEAGDLRIEWKENRTVYMEGPAEEVYNGQWSESRLIPALESDHNTYGAKVQNIS